MKIRLMGTDLFHTDGQKYAYRDRHGEANNRFSQFCEGTSNEPEHVSKQNVVNLIGVIPLCVI